MNNQELTAYVQQVSLQSFHRPFKDKAYWNSRLRTTGGRFFPKDCHLDFNPKFADNDAFEQIVLHELCHYHLYQAHLGYKHTDQDFKLLLAQVGGSRFAPSLEARKVNYVYRCHSCGQKYFRQRKIDTKKYRCGKCRGRLILLESDK